jgi:Ni/Fe-hydrogenase subunit HybB-like protein
VFLIVVLYLVLVENLHRYYLVGSREAALHFLFAGFHGALFWGGMLLVGFVIPLVILLWRGRRDERWVLRASALVVVGVLCERYLIVIPGLSHPPDLFPGMRITSSMFQEGVASYTISLHEVSQALGVLGVIGLLFLLGIKLMPVLPTEARVVGPQRPVPDAG